MEKLKMKKQNYNEQNFNKKVKKNINNYLKDGGEIVMTLKKYRFEMLLIAAKEGLKSFKKQAEERKSKEYVFEAIDSIREMTETLHKLAEKSIVTIKMKSDENN